MSEGQMSTEVKGPPLYIMLLALEDQLWRK